MNLLLMAIIGFVIGVVSNLFPVFGSMFFNLGLGVLFFSYDDVSKSVDRLPNITPWLFVLVSAYLVGTFSARLSQMLFGVGT